MSAKPVAGDQARTDGEESISDNSSGCAACGAAPDGVRVLGNKQVPVCAEHASADPREGDTIVYDVGMRTRGVVIGRNGDSVHVAGVAEEWITVGQVLDVIERDGGA
ncbi:hypothetical protein [Halobaculum magnesiiphilum]|uniref:Uncharacterized protein n=1 Tax=Halobaculum magnesiiphilum TaxID=1017351 RepID=A0A8T8WD25_9EURY|nr:hypothetical protein [Halobaculum magnesiiphilum]QZP37772.1 hypothetical protein K6T50_00905 [Halobaculum magnesiiphilum]